ncbi:hypothetical protein GGU11DRAFT_748783 [Lentinula aff. detonsa]|nr:hypothetical protein GGU11DRAFT_748783 [Lentinula aff. detonsa]
MSGRRRLAGGQTTGLDFRLKSRYRISSSRQIAMELSISNANFSQRRRTGHDFLFIGATLALQEKIPRPIPISKSTYVVAYEEVNIPVGMEKTTGCGQTQSIQKQKIFVILLVKHCVLLDLNEAIPLRDLQSNKVPFVESLLGMLNKSQEGRSHMAIDSDNSLPSVDVERARRGSEGLGISLEANLPAEAALTTNGADKCVGVFDPAVMPFGVITLEDVMEELISEEIYDEFDEEGAHGNIYYVQRCCNYKAGSEALRTQDEYQPNTILILRPKYPVLRPQGQLTSVPLLQLSPAVVHTNRSGRKRKFKSGPIKKIYTHPAELIGRAIIPPTRP